MSSWAYLAISIVFEVIGTTFMKLSNGLTKLWPMLWMFFFYALAFVGLAISLKQIKVSVAYAIWAGFGIILITLIDVVFFKTELGTLRIFAILLIVIGAVVLKILST